jgi:hypothetical protein
MATHRYDEAVLALSDRRWRDAGDAYTLDAHAHLGGEGESGSGAFDDPLRGAAHALRTLLLAGVCYRLADQSDRALVRAGTGRLLTAELRDHVVDAAADRAACEEFRGAFHALSGDDDRADDAFEAAADRYAAAALDDPAGATTRPLLRAGTDLLMQVSGPDDLFWDDVHEGSDPLGRRVRTYRRLPSMLDAVESEGQLYPPRGSTEYGTDFTCPDCGSHDVNYVADTVLCLRCGVEIGRE